MIKVLKLIPLPLAVAEWASVNRGVFVCDECCIIHRNLGRQLSQIKSVQKSNWSGSEFQMVMDLNSNGSNTIWEYNLTSSGNSGFSASFSRSQRKKPSYKDPLHPTKADFIKAKYQSLVFMKKLNTKDELDVDLSDQLHSSVRSSNLKTSLRLLAFGADPNYLHPEKGNTPLHVAAKSGQLTQMELLFAYGADPLLIDVNGKTPLDYAKSAHREDIVERLIEFQFQVTDRLSYFLYGRKPDHKQGQHYLILPMSENQNEPFESFKESKTKLFNLTSQQFEVLAKDVYDEVDRRELDEIWLSYHSQSSTNPMIDYQLVPFLPVYSSFSSIRNQGRQKLARFSAQNFSLLIIDVLTEAKRRQLCSPQSITLNHSNSLNYLNSNFDKSDDSDPLYDSVASDDEEKDYSELEPKSDKANLKQRDSKLSEPNKLIYDIQIKYLELENKCKKSNLQVQELILDNKELKKEIDNLKYIIGKLVEEPYPKSRSSELNSTNLSNTSVSLKTIDEATDSPQSMFEKASTTTKPVSPSSSIPTSPHRVSPAISAKDDRVDSSHDYGVVSNTNLSSLFPTKSEIIIKTEKITRAIKNLLPDLIENQVNSYVIKYYSKQQTFINCVLIFRYISCGQHIVTAVENMISIFPLVIYSVLN